MAKKRLKRHVRRSMKRRMITGKKPMSAEQKEMRKKISEAQRAASKAANSK